MAIMLALSVIWFDTTDSLQYPVMPYMAHNVCCTDSWSLTQSKHFKFVSLLVQPEHLKE